MIAVKVENLTLSSVGFVVLLKGESDQRTLPIYIGAPEAQAILFQLNGVPIPRPLTHDLLTSVIGRLGGSLAAVHISDLREDVFYATLLIDAAAGERIEVDARPSDSIALALRCKAPVFVAPDLMDQAGILLDDDSETSDGKDDEDRDLSRLDVELQEAVKQERYEDAARLRDLIAELNAK